MPGRPGRREKPAHALAHKPLVQKALQEIELSLHAHSSASEIRHRLAELDEIERSLAHLEMPASYGNALYSLRGHVGLLRDELGKAAQRQQGSREAAE